MVVPKKRMPENNMPQAVRIVKKRLFSDFDR